MSLFDDWPRKRTLKKDLIELGKLFILSFLIFGILSLYGLFIAKIRTTNLFVSQTLIFLPLYLFTNLGLVEKRTDIHHTLLVFPITPMNKLESIVSSLSSVTRGGIFLLCNLDYPITNLKFIKKKLSKNDKTVIVTRIILLSVVLSTLSTFIINIPLYSILIPTPLNYMLLIPLYIVVLIPLTHIQKKRIKNKQTTSN